MLQPYHPSPNPYNPLFSEPAYLEYRKDFKSKYEVNDNPAYLMVQNAVPHLIEYLKTSQASLKDDVRHSCETVENGQIATDLKIERTHQMVSDITAGKVICKRLQLGKEASIAVVD